MLFMYIVYCIVLHFNPQLERWAQTLPVPCKKPPPEEESGLVSYKTLEEDRKHASYGSSPDKIHENAEQGMFFFFPRIFLSKIFFTSLFIVRQKVPQNMR